MNEWLLELSELPAIKELFTVTTPMDLISIFFFLMILVAPFVATYTVFKSQLATLIKAVKGRRPIDLQGTSKYTISLLDGSCADLQRLRKSYSPSARVQIIQKCILSRIENEKSEISQSLASQFRKRLAVERKHIGDTRFSKACGGEYSYYVQNARGDS